MTSGSLPPPNPSLPGISGSHDGSGLSLALVTARWNSEITSLLVGGARRAAKHCGVEADRVTELWVPGSFELPIACQRLAATGGFDAIVAIGVVVRGETTHYDLVSENVASGIMSSSLGTGVPIIFGVLATENERQALERAAPDAESNKGFEAVLTAVELVTALASAGA